MFLIHLTLKMKEGDTTVLSKIKETQTQINKWFEEEADKIKLQSGIDDITQSEKVLLYHHELHRKHIKRSLILELATDDGPVYGHDECAEVLANSVKVFLTDPSPLDDRMQGTLLDEVEVVFTEEDNKKMESPPSLAEVKKVVAKAKHLAAPGTDGIPSLLYYKSFDVLGSPLNRSHQGDTLW